MKFPHTTKYKGIWYDAGQEVPCDVVKKEETKVEEKPIVKEEVKEEVKVEEKPRKTLIKKTTKK